jgi:hypothetical protein
MTVSPAGDALLWPAIDADVYVPGLVERALETVSLRRRPAAAAVNAERRRR